MTWLPTALEHNPAALLWLGLAAVFEVASYLTLASERSRAWWSRERLMLLAPAAYLLYSVPLGVFSAQSLAVILAAAAAASYWFRVLPKSRWADFGFVLLIAAPLLFKLMPLVYARPLPEVRVDFLGHLLWIRIGVITVLRDCRTEGIRFGFLPSAREWRIGLAYYAALAPVAFLLAALTGFAQFAAPARSWWEMAVVAAAVFVGILWVVALSEELFFRGLLQQWFEQLFGNKTAALLVASALFGAVHLGFRSFPNWQFALVAGVAGVFYGLSFRRAGGIRAAMVTHALTVVTWKTFFR